MKKIYSLLLCCIFILNSCNTENKETADKTNAESADAANQSSEQVIKANSSAEILAKTEVPILCYHRISDGNKGDYTVSEKTFTEHIKTLSDSGYHSVSPDQLYDYLVFNKELPEKPFMISFDDSRIEHFEIAAPILEKYGYRGAFFIMTITNNKKNYMSTEQIAKLAEAGHTIGLHSWDHTMATKYKDSIDWQKQVIAPKEKLEKIIAKSVDYWAYPNGVTNHTASEGLSEHFKISFILSSKRDSILPLQTVRRIIIPDYKAQNLINSMKRSF
jgi:peptidoglycan/xylan/chitin deacetylase (PgdA/CDA1 family)